ncbi:hypothetical protein PHIN8_11670 [Polynucleobacter sp. HIN8]|uniref:hypothetical protein n=1 Tax=Polynucleobacter sp. HIN8 TaxID=3047867 RepID=UPI002573F1F1|nr:hypothetical protein [Polynucleobacter sp. HIN8]BEI39223.1 hypothetical protein PHIN8_11670 [Polynucleobacter sp. HIN8]
MAKSASAKDLVADVIHQLMSHEAHDQLRKRARKKKDFEIFQRQIETIVCEAVHRYLTGANKRIAISLSNRHLGRKDAQSNILNNTISQNLKNLSSPVMAFLELQAGDRNEGQVTTFWAGKRLITRIKERQLGYNDLTLEHSKNVIELRDKKAEGQSKGKLIRYEETPLTRQYRDEMEQINAFLREADICYHGNKDIDDSRVELKRIFNNGSFEEGGRLYGGFWISMKSEDLRDVMIDDEWVVTLDYGQMAVRLAYSLAKAPIHFDDGYLIPRREWAREATKKLINIMLNSPDAKNWSVPKKVRDYYKDQDVQKRLIEEIKSFHKPIEHLFGKPNGMKFMFLESEILIDVLLELNSQGILALPIHDGLLVKPSQQDIAKQVMLKVFKKHTNLVATVSIENL